MRSRHYDPQPTATRMITGGMLFGTAMSLAVVSFEGLTVLGWYCLMIAVLFGVPWVIDLHYAAKSQRRESDRP